jgi:hypothetical protein
VSQVSASLRKRHVIASDHFGSPTVNKRHVPKHVTVETKHSGVAMRSSSVQKPQCSKQALLPQAVAELGEV